MTHRLTMQQLKGEQERDMFVCYARNSLSSGRWRKVKPVDPAKSKFWNHKDSFCFGADGELRTMSDDQTEPEGLLVLPSSLVPTTLEAFHNKTAHPGAASTSENIRRIYTGGQISTKISLTMCDPAKLVPPPNPIYTHVPHPLLNPNCVLDACVMRLNVRCSLHFIVFVFFGNVTTIPLVKSSGHCPFSYISLQKQISSLLAVPLILLECHQHPLLFYLSFV